MNPYFKCQTVSECWQGENMKMHHNIWKSMCNKSALKTLDVIPTGYYPDTECWPCLSLNVKAKKNLKPNSSNGKLWKRLMATIVRSGGGRQRPVEREQPVDSSQVEIFVIFTILFEMHQPIIISKLQNTKFFSHFRGWKSKQRKATYNPDYKATMNRQGR